MIALVKHDGCVRRALRTALLAAMLCALSGSGHGAELYRWVDEQGRTHFGDTVPERYRDKATRVGSSTPPTDAQRRDALERAARQRAAADALAARKSVPPPRATGNAAAAPPTDPRQRCAYEKARYEASAECFAPFRNANGSLKPEAFEKCESVPMPDCSEN